jgi:hypothetical protein
MNLQNDVLGIQQTKEMGNFLVATVVLGDQQLADGFQGTDLIALAALMPLGVVAFQGADEIPAEIADMTTAEAEEFKKIFDKLDLRNDGAEDVTRVILREIVNLQQSIRNVSQAIKRNKKDQEEGDTLDF